MISNIKKITDIWKKLVAILDKKKKKNCIFIFIIMLLSALMEMLGISAVLPFLTLMLSPEEISKNKYINIIKVYTGIEDIKTLLIIMAIGIFLIYLFKNIFMLLFNYIRLKFENGLQKDLSVLMLSSYMKRPYIEMININSAEVLRGVGEDITGIYYIIQSSFLSMASMVTILLIILFLIATDPLMSLGLLIIAGGSIFLLTVSMKKQVGKSGAVFNQSLLMTTKSATQAVGGLKDITVMRRNENFVEYFDKACEERRKAQLKYRFLQGMPTPVIETVFVGGLIFIIAIKLGGDTSGEQMLPKLAAFALAAVRIMPLVAGISANISTIMYYIPSFNNTYNNVIKAKKYLQMNQDTNTGEGADIGVVLSFENEMTVEGIDWSYEGTEQKVIDNLSMKIKKGQSIALIGESGAGKTTLVDLILGLMEPQKGSIKTDGVSISVSRKKWAQLIGYVPQTVYLLDDTIKKNILFGNDTEDNGLIWRAIEQAQLTEFINSLPFGIETLVGERGVRLSGGQRQRIAIARALYYNPQILVLDEATSALDNDTESAVMNAIESLQGEKTLIIVAHRLSTIKNCDIIYEVKCGKILKRNKEELIN